VLVSGPYRPSQAMPESEQELANVARAEARLMEESAALLQRYTSLIDAVAELRRSYERRLQAKGPRQNEKNEPKRSS
jgi:hypothetical protein